MPVYNEIGALALH